MLRYGMSVMIAECHCQIQRLTVTRLVRLVARFGEWANMCEETNNEHYIDVEWTPLVENQKQQEKMDMANDLGSWDIVASFADNDEVILEQMMTLPVAKVMIMDYYAQLYAHKAILSIRRRMRPFKTRHDRIAERLEQLNQEEYWVDESGC